jgi:hypothetical protein
VDVDSGYDPATKQTKERISHAEGKVVSTWMCPDDPWLVDGEKCQRLETSITSDRYYGGLQQAIDHMPQDRPYSAQKINCAGRDRLQTLLIEALQPQVPTPNEPAVQPAPAVSWPTLGPGASGEAVATVQYLLRYHGADVAVDGDFGEQTGAAVARFRAARGLAPGTLLRGSTAHQTVTPETWAALVNGQ